MQITHIANPVGVKAIVITEVMQMPGGARLVLADGSNTQITRPMMSRHEPAVGDYLVTQEDGYQYINPKEVFERKYAPVLEMPNASTAPAEGVGPKEFKKRVVRERDQLSENITKLNAFLVTPAYDRLDAPERSRLTKQADAMRAYCAVLNDRIEAQQQG